MKNVNLGLHLSILDDTIMWKGIARAAVFLLCGFPVSVSEKSFFSETGSYQEGEYRTMDSTTIILIILGVIAAASLLGLFIAKPKRKNNPLSGTSSTIDRLTELTASTKTTSAAAGRTGTPPTRTSGAIAGPGDAPGGAKTSSVSGYTAKGPVSSGSGTRAVDSGRGASTSGGYTVTRSTATSSGTAADTSDRSEAIYSFLRDEGLIHCPSCGVEYRKGTDVCIVCGQKL